MILNVIIQFNVIIIMKFNIIIIVKCFLYSKYKIIHNFPFIIQIIFVAV